MSEPVLVCTALNKSYKNGEPVIENLNISLPAGRIIGLLGPNGCGKTTLMKMIAGILVPTSGEIQICGEPRSEKSNALISYLPERPYFNQSMTVAETLAYFCDFYSDFDLERAKNMLRDLGIDEKKRLKHLSKGMKEKVQLVLVMSRRAKLYLLDEPIAGVDPAARDYILSTIISNYAEDASIIITTHLIHDIEPVLDEFVFLGFGGKVLLSGVADDVRAERGKSLDEIFREVFKC